MKNLGSNSKNWMQTIICALLITVSILLLLFIQYFQSYGISLKRAFAGLLIFLILGALNFFVIRYLFFRISKGGASDVYKWIGYWVVIAILFSPHAFPTPHYPVSSIFRHTSDLTISVRFQGNPNDLVQLRGVWLDFDDKKISSADFRSSSEWSNESGKLFINSSDEGVLIWHGKIGELARLTIFPMDKPAKVTILWDGEKTVYDLQDMPISLLKKSETPNWYYGVLLLARIIVIAYALLVVFSLLFLVFKPRQRSIGIIFVLTLLSLLVVYEHFQSIDITERFDLQVQYHQSILSGVALSPWQYRVFSEWVVEGITRLFSSLGYEKAFYFASLIVRIFQSVLTYFLAYAYIKKLGFKEWEALIGMVFLTGSFINSYYNTGFSLNTYFDLVFYLCAGLVILNGSFLILPLLMAVAALNRETSGLIPFIALFGYPHVRKDKSKVLLAVFSFLIWMTIFVALRVVFQPRELFVPYGHPPGISLLQYNLSVEWLPFLFRFFSILPILGILVFQDWNIYLKRLFLVLVPIWVSIHLIASVISEARLFLVPEALVFIPAFLVFNEKLTSKMKLRDQLSGNYEITKLS